MGGVGGWRERRGRDEGGYVNVQGLACVPGIVYDCVVSSWQWQRFQTPSCLEHTTQRDLLNTDPLNFLPLRQTALDCPGLTYASLVCSRSRKSQNAPPRGAQGFPPSSRFTSRFEPRASRIEFRDILNFGGHPRRHG